MLPTHERCPLLLAQVPLRFAGAQALPTDNIECICVTRVKVSGRCARFLDMLGNLLGYGLVRGKNEKIEDHAPVRNDGYQTQVRILEHLARGRASGLYSCRSTWHLWDAHRSRWRIL
ncbi:hypothetical protein BD779DRAFT_1577036 [Infundibulicybe gibba]|nr:hypothetical protein BD779DRAFT_1577036 [Infundibulicybe gibba]